jgi:serine/threonine protein kinase
VVSDTTVTQEKVNQMNLLNISSMPEQPESFLPKVGEIFAKFDQHTQDSGNVSYGVETDGIRFFVKTAGAPNSKAFLTHTERVFWLTNAVRVNSALRDPVLPRILNTIESPHGLVLVYEWVPGDLIGVPEKKRSDPASSFHRFKSLPLNELVAALTSLFRVHAEFCSRGWIANDFYDGAMIYDFASGRLSLVDLDMYRDTPFPNDMGRMFGSTRFMAPEEFELGAEIDESTTVFNMGRCVDVFLGERIETAAIESLLDVGKGACQPERQSLWSSMREFHDAWLQAIAHLRDKDS